MREKKNKPAKSDSTFQKTLRSLLVVGSLLLILLAIFITPALIRLYYIYFHKDDYKPDQFMVEYYSDNTQGISFGGYVVSTNERYASETPALVGTLDKVRKINKETPIIGHTTPILYIPLDKAPLLGIDLFKSYRILRPDEIQLPNLTYWTLFVSTLWLFGITTFIIGVKQTLKAVKKPESPE